MVTMIWFTRALAPWTTKASELLHVDEVWAVLRMLAKKEKVSSLGPDASPSEVWCEEKLVQVSRSFAMVIRQLPEVRDGGLGKKTLNT